jgi:paraquat-inducible protein A
MTDEQRKKVLFWLKILGKWSMLDVFVVAIVIVAVKFGLMAKAEPRAGVYVFGAAILLSMFLTFSVDLISSKHSRQN